MRLWRMRLKLLRLLLSAPGVTVLLVSTAPHGLVFGQESHVAIRPEQAALYHLDFARHFFAGPEAEKAERARLEATLKDLESLKGKVERSADNLQRALQLNDRGAARSGERSDGHCSRRLSQIRRVLKRVHRS